MNGRKFKIGAILLIAAMLMVGVGSTRIPCSVCNLLVSYQAVKNSPAPMSFWDRVVYTFALSKQRAHQS